MTWNGGRSLGVVKEFLSKRFDSSFDTECVLNSDDHWKEVLE
jgi:hypothetical protein